MSERETPPPEVTARDNHHKHKVQRSGCKVLRSGPTSVQVGTGCSNNMQLQPPPPPAIIATCVRAHHCNSFHALPLLCALTQVAMIAASCTPPAPVLILTWSVVAVVGVACCCCIPFRLVLMLVLTFAPCTLTFAPCACGGCHRQQLMVVVFLP